MDSRQQTSRHYTMFIFFLMLFNKTIRIYYGLFVYRFYYNFLNLVGRGFAGRGLTRLWPAGMGRAWTSTVRAGPGLDQTLTVCAYILACGPGPGWA